MCRNWSTIDVNFIFVYICAYICVCECVERERGTNENKEMIVWKTESAEGCDPSLRGDVISEVV